MVAMFSLWFIHLAYLAILFKFPFFGKRMMKKAGLIHAVSVSTALLVCLIGPTITLWWCGYFTARFPNLVCMPSNLDMLFYTIALPLNITAVFCVTIALAVVWEIHKVCALTIYYTYTHTHKHMHTSKYTYGYTHDTNASSSCV